MPRSGLSAIDGAYEVMSRLIQMQFPGSHSHLDQVARVVTRTILTFLE